MLKATTATTTTNNTTTIMMVLDRLEFQCDRIIARLAAHEYTAEQHSQLTLNLLWECYSQTPGAEDITLTAASSSMLV